MPGARGLAAGLGLAMLAGCAAGPGGPTGEAADREAFAPEYLGIEARMLDETLVNFIVEMSGARDESDLTDYARCAAAHYALTRGYGFARHVRTRTAVEAGVWRSDAVYTISPALPRGAQTIDAEVTVEACAERGIPTV